MNEQIKWVKTILESRTVPKKGRMKIGDKRFHYFVKQGELFAFNSTSSFQSPDHLDEEGFEGLSPSSIPLKKLIELYERDQAAKGYKTTITKKGNTTVVSTTYKKQGF